MPTPPVWFLDNGQSTGSAVLVLVRKIGTSIAEQRLLTAQHVLRLKADAAADPADESYKRNGPYAQTIYAWAPDYAVDQARTYSVPVTVDTVLTAQDSQPLLDHEDIAFLTLNTGAEPASLLSNEECQPGLKELDIYGYIGGYALIAKDKGVTKPAPFVQLDYLSYDEINSMGTLAGASKAGGGVSGGGIFQGNRYAGLYRGEFQAVGQQTFIPVSRVRAWCLDHGYELVDHSISTQVDKITGAIKGLESVKEDKAVKAKIDAGRQEMQGLQTVLAEFLIYKTLHDHLHLIQKNYANAAKASRVEPFEGLALDTFNDASSGMDEEAGKTERTIRKIPPQFTALSTDAGEWFEKLQAGIATATSVSSDGSQAKAQTACRALGRVLRKHLPEINEQLVKKARAMVLNRLAQLFADLSVLPNIPADTINGLKEGVKACDLVRLAISSRMSVHDQWQEIDLILWDAEQCLISEDMDGFTAQWGDIFAILNPLLTTDNKSAWALQLNKHAASIAASFATADPWKSLGTVFENFMRGVRSRFFWVDLDLKDQAETIAELGKPLELLA